MCKPHAIMMEYRKLVFFVCSAEDDMYELVLMLLHTKRYDGGWRTTAAGAVMMEKLIIFGFSEIFETALYFFC